MPSSKAQEKHDDAVVMAAQHHSAADERAVRELLEDRALAKGLLEIIQQSLVDQRWQTLGDLYRGKTLFLSQDLLNRIDSALEAREHIGAAGTRVALRKEE